MQKQGRLDTKTPGSITRFREAFTRERCHPRANRRAFSFTWRIELTEIADTGRFAQSPVEVLFDRICRENGGDHILTEPRSPTTTGKIERFHHTLRVEVNTRQVFRNLKTSSEALDEWVTF